MPARKKKTDKRPRTGKKPRQSASREGKQKSSGRTEGSINRTTLERMNAAEGMLLRHYAEPMAVQALRKEYGVSEKTARRYIDLVRDRWLETSDRGRPVRRSAAVNRLLRIAREHSNSGTTLVACERLIAEIEGTRAPERVEHTLSLESETEEAITMLARAFGVDPKDLEDGD